MNSSPLFMSVAESTEILRPMTQFGCAQACSGRDLLETRAIGQSRNGPPEAVSRMRRTPGGASPRTRVARQALEDRVVLAVDRQQRGARRAHRAHQQRARP